MNKKSQASTLILLIMILLVFYIIFLPESERAKILQSDENGTETSSVSTSVSKITLLSEDVGTIEEVIEPYLMQLGFLVRTPRGRTVTPLAMKHLNK